MQGILEQADSLRQAGDWLAAEELYRQLAENDPANARAHFQRGNVLCRLSRFAEAAEMFQHVVELKPDLIVAHFNLGNVLCQLSRHEEAVHSYRRAIEVSPAEPDADAAYNLAKTLVDLGRWDEAIPYYRLAIARAPQFFEAYSNLGQLLFAMRRPQEALELHAQAIELQPDHAAEHFNLARTLASLGRFDEAADSFRRVLALNPLSGASYQMLGQIFHAQGRYDDAALVIADWQRAMPGDPRCEHMQSAWLGGPSAPRATDDYVRTLFDSFADDFDATLERLNYRAPQLAADALARQLAARSELRDELAVLDAGCGTGLCGPHLRTFARRLVGVDLSAGMLARARQRSLYDELIEAELTAYLQACSEQYDAIISADTLCYFGDLAEVLSAARHALRPGGRLIFTVEHLQDAATSDEYALHSHGRYAHAEEYVRRALAGAGLRTTEIRAAALRNEGVCEVAGLVVVAEV